VIVSIELIRVRALNACGIRVFARIGRAGH